LRNSSNFRRELVEKSIERSAEQLRRISESRQSLPKRDASPEVLPGQPTMNSLLNESMSELLNLQSQINEHGNYRITNKSKYVNHQNVENTP